VLQVIAVKIKKMSGYDVYKGENPLEIVIKLTLEFSLIIETFLLVAITH
jgi:hypothetical protein